MALDHALAACLQEGEAVLRLYGWERPTVSLGRNEAARGLYRERPDVGYVRRPTGGRAVAHWRELTYAVVAPLHAWGGLRAAYVAINEALAKAVTGLGIPAALAQAALTAGARGHGVSLRLDGGPCFRSAAPGEVVAAGRKLIGSAQARLEGALLQHGSILVEDDQALLAALAIRGGRDEDRHRPATLRALLGDVSIDALRGRVAMSLRETFGGKWAVAGYRAGEIETAGRLESTRYARDSWTWRR